MKVTFIPTVNSALGIVSNGLIKRLDDLEITGRVDTIQTTTLLKSARILRRVPETRDLLSTNSSKKPPANSDIKK